MFRRARPAPRRSIRSREKSTQSRSTSAFAIMPGISPTLPPISRGSRSPCWSRTADSVRRPRRRSRVPCSIITFSARSRARPRRPAPDRESRKTKATSQWPVTPDSMLSGLRSTPIAALPQLARGPTLASLRRLTLGADRRAIPLRSAPNRTLQATKAMGKFFALVATIWEVLARRVDSYLMAAALAIVGIGLITLFSASDQNISRVTSQVMSLGFALLLMWVVANIQPRQLARAALPLYIMGVLLLVAVALGGTVVNGSRRWLNFGFARFQPSALMKIALPLMLAWYFQKHETRIRFRDFILSGVLIALPVWLIKREPDLGTALMIGASGFYVLYLAGLSWKIMLGLLAAAAAAAPLVWPHLHDYQQERILTFIDPARDPLGAGYHSSQASIALGSGGVIGKGWLNGTQTHLDFLPERHTDFIFAVFGEEIGLIGNTD